MGPAQCAASIRHRPAPWVMLHASGPVASEAQQAWRRARVGVGVVGGVGVAVVHMVCSMSSVKGQQEGDTLEVGG